MIKRSAPGDANAMVTGLTKGKQTNAGKLPATTGPLQPPHVDQAPQVSLQGDPPKDALTKMAVYARVIKAAGPYGTTTVGVQSRLPVGAKRQLDRDEEEAVTAGQARWLPTIYESFGTPVSEMMSSPSKGALLGALAFGGLGAAGGGIVGSKLNDNGTVPGAILGGSAGALAGGLGSYLARDQRNRDLLDILRRIPRSGKEPIAKRDIESDPVYAQQQQQLRDDLDNMGPRAYAGSTLGVLASRALGG